MTKKERFLRVAAALEQLYPDARCSLFSGNAFELLVAVRLSAQCTDARVNQVTPALFAKYPTLEDYCNADVADIERLIYSCGFYKTKAENIIEMARKVRDDYDGRVPDTIEDLLTLPGVGRKTANLIVGDVYGKESVVVDTHMIRIANRLGLVATNLGEAWRLAEGKELGDKIMAMMGTFPVAFANPLPSLHPLDLLIGFSCGAGLRLAVYLRSKNAKKYRHGMEYGSARWGTHEDIAPYILSLIHI